MFRKFLASITRAGGPRPRSGLVGSQVAYAAVGPLLVVEADPVGDDDASFGERIELLAVEAFVTEAGVKGFDLAVLPRRAGVDVEGADTAVGQTVADSAGDKLGPVVGADVLKGSMGLDGLGEHDHDVVGADAAGDMMGDALLRVLVDEHEGAEAASSRRDVRHEVPRPHMAGVGGLRGDATGGAAWPGTVPCSDAARGSCRHGAPSRTSVRGRPAGAPEGPAGLEFFSSAILRTRFSSRRSATIC